jgi:cell division protein FtsI/penicillin-binding protein 2
MRKGPMGDRQWKHLWPRRTLLQTALFGCLPIEPSGGLLQPSFVRELTERSAKLFPGRKTAVLLLSLDTGEVPACFQAEDFFRKACPMGSLIKPFTALAFAVSHQRKNLPRYYCPPRDQQESMENCWYPPGHGSIDLENALAHSCNRYFHALAQETGRADFLDILVRFGWIGEEQQKNFLSLSEREILSLMTGFSLRLQTEPIRVAYAFAALYNEGMLFLPGDPHRSQNLEYRRVVFDPTVVEAIHRGMHLCVREGTGRLLGRHQEEICAKTGTVSLRPGSHNPVHLEGWCVGLDLRIGQRVLVLARVRPGRGATEAAPLAGEALKLFLQWRRQERV